MKLKTRSQVNIIATLLFTLATWDGSEYYQMQCLKKYDNIRITFTLNEAWEHLFLTFSQLSKCHLCHLWTFHKNQGWNCDMIYIIRYNHSDQRSSVKNRNSRRKGVFWWLHHSDLIAVKHSADVTYLVEDTKYDDASHTFYGRPELMWRSIK